MSAMECADVASFTFCYVTNNIVFLCKFMLAEVTVINLFSLLRVFLVGLGNWSEFFGYFIKASSEIWREMKYLLK